MAMSGSILMRVWPQWIFESHFPPLNTQELARVAFSIRESDLTYPQKF